MRLFACVILLALILGAVRHIERDIHSLAQHVEVKR